MNTGTRGRSATAQVARDGAVGLVGATSSAVLGLALVLVVSRGLGAEGAGEFFRLVAAFSIALGLSTLGADTALLRTLSRQQAEGQAVHGRRVLLIAFLPVIAFSTVLACGTILVATVLPQAVSAQQNPVLRGIVLLAPLLVIGAVGGLAVQGLRGVRSLLPYVLLQNVALPAARLVAVGATAWLGFSATTVAAWWGLPLLLVSGVAGVMLWRALPPPHSRSYDRQQVGDTMPSARDFWRFAAPRGLASVLDLGLTWADVLLVGLVLGAGPAGVYAAVTRVAMSGTLVQQALRVAIAPRISGMLAVGRTADAGDIYRSATALAIAASWPLYLTLALFSPTVLGVFGPDFVSGGLALAILACAMLVHIGTGSVQTVLLMAGHSTWLLANKAAALTVNIVLNLLLLPVMGISGAATAWAAAIVVDNVAALLQVRRVVGLATFDRRIVTLGLTTLIIFGLIGSAFRAVYGYGPAALGLHVVLAGVVYVAWLARFGRSFDLTTVIARRKRVHGGTAGTPVDAVDVGAGRASAGSRDAGRAEQ